MSNLKAMASVKSVKEAFELQSSFATSTMEQALADPIYRADPPVPTPGGATFNEMVATERKVEIPAAQEPEALLNGLCR